jgi:hypothetical protein
MTARSCADVCNAHRIVEDEDGMLYGYHSEGQRRPSHVYELISDDGAVRPFTGVELFTSPEGQRPQGGTREKPVPTEDRSLAAADKALRTLLIAMQPWAHTFHGAKIIGAAETSQQRLARLREGEVDRAA